MTKLLKRIYLTYLSIFTMIITVFFIVMPESLNNSNNRGVNFAIGYLFIVTLTIILIILEAKLKVLKPYWLILYIVAGLLLPIVLLFWEYIYLVFVISVSPLLILNIFIKRKKKYDFNVNNANLVSLIFNTSNILAVIILMTKQRYWYLAVLLIVLSQVINLVIYYLVRQMKEDETSDLFSLASVFIIFANALNAEIRLNYFQSFNFVSDLLVPLIIVVLIVIAGFLNQRQINKLINCSSTE